MCGIAVTTLLMAVSQVLHPCLTRLILVQIRQFLCKPVNFSANSSIMCGISVTTLLMAVSQVLYPCLAQSAMFTRQRGRQAACQFGEEALPSFIWRLVKYIQKLFVLEPLCGVLAKMYLVRIPDALGQS